MTTNSISFEDETYGAIAPDIPNYLFGFPYQSYLHFETQVEFMKVWSVIKRGYEKPMAYGFISHNDIWGADSTAHNAALTTGLSEGYVITKAKILLDDLAPLFISFFRSGSLWFRLRSMFRNLPPSYRKCCGSSDKK